MLAFSGEELIQQVVSVASNASEQSAIGIITDTGESCRMLSPVGLTQFCTHLRSTHAKIFAISLCVFVFVLGCFVSACVLSMGLVARYKEINNKNKWIKFKSLKSPGMRMETLGGRPEGGLCIAVC